MGGRSVSRFCEVCGSRFELPGPDPGELGLDRIKTAFRFCTSCGLVVGHACCWNSRTGSCISCAAVGHILQIPSRQADDGTDVRRARRALAQLATMVLATRRFATRLDTRLTHRNTLALSAWEEAWWEAGWLILRAESSRDAASEALSRAFGSEHLRAQTPNASLLGSADRYPQLAAEMTGQLDAYREARAAIEKRLAMAGRPLGGAEKRPPQPLRGPRLAVALASFVAILTVTTVMAGAAIMGGALERPFGVTPTPSQQVGGVLGTRTGPSRAPASTAAARALRPLAMIDFNLLRIGDLGGASPSIESVTGDAEVVPFPTPFDRSLRLNGSGPHEFCLEDPLIDGSRLSVSFDLYSKSAIGSGSLELNLDPRSGNATTVDIPLSLLHSLPSGHWYHLRAAWEEGPTIAVDISQRGRGLLLSETLRPTDVASYRGPGFCLAASGMGSGVQLVLDNIQVQG